MNATDLCATSTAYDRFRDRVAAGVFLKRWQVGVEPFDELKGIDWDWLRMDRAMTKVPLGGKTGPNPTDRGKAGVKRSVLTEGLSFVVFATVIAALYFVIARGLWLLKNWTRIAVIRK